MAHQILSNQLIPPRLRQDIDERLSIMHFVLSLGVTNLDLAYI